MGYIGAAVNYLWFMSILGFTIC